MVSSRIPRTILFLFPNPPGPRPFGSDPPVLREKHVYFFFQLAESLIIKCQKIIS